MASIDIEFPLPGDTVATSILVGGTYDDVLALAPVQAGAGETLPPPPPPSIVIVASPFPPSTLPAPTLDATAKTWSVRVAVPGTCPDQTALTITAYLYVTGGPPIPPADSVAVTVSNPTTGGPGTPTSFTVTITP